MIEIYRLLITDVTRYRHLFCVAGWDLNCNRMIRPEPPGATAQNESSRFWSNDFAGPEKFFDVGNVVEIAASTPPPDFPFPHATEDRIYFYHKSNNLIKKLSHAEMIGIFSSSTKKSIKDIFGGLYAVSSSGKLQISANTLIHSLDSINIMPNQISFYSILKDNGRKQLRGCISEGATTYDFSITADAANSLFINGKTDTLTNAANSSRWIHVRLGLSRPFGKFPDTCFAQINGLYFL